MFGFNVVQISHNIQIDLFDPHNAGCKRNRDTHLN